MPLDKAALKAALKAAFLAGKASQEWTEEDAAGAMADAIDAYVRAAAVTGVTVDVKDDGAVHIGTGTQVGTGTLA